ncbi:hypothetical protein SCL_2167 [Sulfuricaulis limicola]|uniref:Uncharacterized protein n=1 Tax=Sulfuricaulis limicola TaxID=1620215 RepID=A0A1B4XI49_9GAMM|nr:hypothetical protein [Sulfuricaulis limicola]BAV34456.1 hypothetical protein SCL_2167 [Sulfuricaulis limicola]
MRVLMILLVFSMLVFALPMRAADKTAPENTEAQKKQDQPRRAERPQREAVKLSPHARESAPRPDESDQMKRVAPPRAESPLQNVPALMDPPPGVKVPVNP